MRVVVRLFSTEALLLGRDQVQVDLPDEGPTCGALRQRLAAVEPGLTAALRTARFAVNHAFAPDGQPIAPGDEVALIGLVSGG